MPSVTGKTGYPKTFNRIVAPCQTGAMVLIKVVSEDSNDSLNGVNVTVSLNGVSAAATTDQFGQAHFPVTDLPDGAATPFTVLLVDATLGARKSFPEVAGDYKVSCSGVNYLTLTLGPPILEVFSANLAGKNLSLAQGIHPVPFEVDLIASHYRGRIRLSVVENGRERNRSGAGAAGYLSRLRITLNADGIQQPIQLPYEFDYTGISPAFYAVGVESGQETLIAELIRADNFTLPADGLTDQITTTCQPAAVGAFRVYYAVADDDFLQPDLEFSQILGVKRPGLDLVNNAVRLAVLDNGIFQASFGPRIVAAQSFVDGAFQDYADYEPLMDDRHGTAVTGQAAFGTDGIRFLDVRMAKGQLGGAANLVALGIQWAVGLGIDVLTTSVGFRWDEATIAPHVTGAAILFVSTAGNNRAVIGPGDRSRYATPAGVLVARCKLDRATHLRTPHDQAGTGAGVDIVVPGDFTNLNVPRAFKASINTSVQARFDLRMNNYDQMVIAQAAWDVAKNTWLDEKTAGMSPMLRRMNRARLSTDYEDEVPTAGRRPDVPTRPDQPNLSDINDDLSRDEGVSFGVPVVANIAAKLKLIAPGLTPAQIKSLLIDTSDHVSGLKATSISQGVVNPLRAYFAAFDV